MPRPFSHSSLGLAYIGLTGLDDVTGVQTNITFTEDPNDTTVPWTITANSSTVTFNETLYMYIVPDSGNMTQVGFAANGSVPDGGVTTGFACKNFHISFCILPGGENMVLRRHLPLNFRGGNGH